MFLTPNYPPTDTHSPELLVDAQHVTVSSSQGRACNYVVSIKIEITFSH